MDYIDQAKSSECFKAFKSLKLAGYFYGWLLLLCVAVQVAGFSIVYFGNVLAPLSNDTPVVVSDPDQHHKSLQAAEMFRDSLRVIFPITRFLSVFCVCLLVASAALGTQLSMISKSSGIRGYIGAFFWTIFLLIIVIPWQKVFGSNFAAGALYDLSEILSAMDRYGPGGGNKLTDSLLPLRFIGYPAILIFVWLMAQIRFANAAGCIKKEYNELCEKIELEQRVKSAQKKLFPEMKD